MSSLTATHKHSATALSTRLFLAGLATAELMATYLGIRLGLYDALRSGPATAAQLAGRAGIAPRYAREWLEQQAVAGILEVDEVTRPAAQRCYSLPPGHAQALLGSDEPAAVAPLALLPIGGVARVLPRLLDAFRTGNGVPYAAYGEDSGGGPGLNLSVFRHQLSGWVRTALPDVHARLSAGGARVADVACGRGWSSIALARAYPRIHVDGLDSDRSSIEDARANAAAAGLSDRVSFAVHCAGRDTVSYLAGRYDLVCLFDALHDMPRPVDVLRACRALCHDGGCVLLMEPRARETFTAPADQTERFLYAVSVLHCLPVGLSERPSVATGALLRPLRLAEYATAAGFRQVRPLPIEHRFHRVYRLDG